ncbi:MAG: hypothetical protein AAF830_11735 [Pseudomonadota bacterium]
MSDTTTPYFRAGAAEQDATLLVEEENVAGTWVDLDTVRRALADTTAALPEDLATWPDAWFALSAMCFATWKPNAAPYDFAGLMQEAYELPEEEAAVLGFDGHGINSVAMHLLWKRGPVLIGFQTASGGVLMEQDAGAARIEATWRMITAVETELDRLTREGAASPGGGLPTGKTLVALDSDIAESWLAWADTGRDWETIERRRSRFAGFDARNALEAL